ncbi:hypothetical protein ACGFIP_04580 [Micromonospora zamorensis]|uniref:SUKH-3 immunity protein n=1 Tax=Micromonospora zamorensis TaxID=709883 RepID=A0ABZ1P8F5_9ACTN|nr:MULTISPECIES: hypothetical protein [Micromonospora]WSK48393.1 hypothetical protein OG423_31170 [Micromonospora zamorensis]
MSDHDADRRAGAAVPVEGGEAARRLAERRAWRIARSAEFALELAILPGRRWESSKGATLALMARVSAVPAIEEAVFAVWDLAREDPPPGRDRVYAARGDEAPIVVGHAESATLVARSGGPVLVVADALGRTVWRVEADQMWAEDLAEIFRELWEVAHGRPAVDESAVPAMPPLPWQQDRV